MRGRCVFFDSGPVLVMALLASCQTLPVDPLAQARDRLDHGELVQALEILDRMPPGDRDYLAAQAQSMVIERRIRTSHERVLEGLALRAAGRDEAAIEKFDQALATWPSVAGAAGLSQATRYRLATRGAHRWLREVMPSRSPISVPNPDPSNADLVHPDPTSLDRTNSEPASPETASPEVLAAEPAFGTPETTPAAPLAAAPGAVVASDPSVEPTGRTVVSPVEPAGASERSVDHDHDHDPDAVAREISRQGEAGQSKGGDSKDELRAADQLIVRTPSQLAGEPPAAGLAVIEKVGGGAMVAESAPKMPRLPGLERVRRRLDAGQNAVAMSLLERLWQERPRDRRVVKLFGQVLHQRALLAYGQGRLGSAIEDWRRVVAMPGSNPQAQRFLQAAEKELAARPKQN